MIAMFEFPVRPLQPWAHGPRFLWFGFLVGIALLSARWVAEIVSPRPVAALPAAPTLTSPVTVSDILKVVDKAGAVATRTTDLELTGIYVKGRNSGFATFQSSQGPLLVHVGDEIHPGLRLAAVAKDRVTLRGNGSEWQLEMKSGPALQKAAPSPSLPRK